MCVYSDATFTMKSGTITGNTATSNSNGNGGNGGGVFVGNGATFNLTGSPTITSNTGSNVYLTENIKIKIAGALTEAASVGVTMASPGVFTSGLSGKGGVANFESDDPNYGVRLNDANEARLARLYDITLPTASTAGNVTASVNSESVTKAEQNDTVTLTVTPGTNYACTSLTVTKKGDETQTVQVGTDKTFTMPAYPVTVNATFAQKIEPPTANTGLVYNGSAQTGVAAGTGYTLTENTGTDAGDYTATATLESGYI